MRLNKFIAKSGECSRRQADKYVQGGSVTVNGSLELNPAYQVLGVDDIRFDGRRITSSEKTITAWIPLQKVTLNMGPLEFSAGSQKIIYGRELSISDESEIKIDKKLRLTDYNHVVEPFDVGEISFHSGWIFHRAGENSSKEIRKVMTIIYMDDNMKLKKPENKGQENDWKTWCPGARIGEKIDTPLNPVLI